ncbi:MAG: hypothetical protein HWE30_03185 [Methylocystaceae bacterium]|nr:hypothetical protein [Methylocystaceae bacterium]
MSFIDATQALISYSPFVGGAQPMRPVTGTGEVPVGFKAEVIDGTYYPDRPMPARYRPLEDPYSSSASLLPGFQENYGAGSGIFSSVAYLYANQGRFLASTLAGQDANNGINIRA